MTCSRSGSKMIKKTSSLIQNQFERLNVRFRMILNMTKIILTILKSLSNTHEKTFICLICILRMKNEKKVQHCSEKYRMGEHQSQHAMAA